MKKTKKFTKIALASSLALFMGAGVLCSGLIFPMKTANSNALGAENSVITNESLAEEIKSYKEDIASGKIKYAPSPLGLDPANDPVIYTTETGIEIKSSNAINNPNLSKYVYITMGSYDNYAINWLICGVPRLTSESSSPAGAAINAEISKNYYHSSPISGTSGSYYDTTLSTNNFSVISECVLGTTASTEVFISQSSSVADSHRITGKDNYNYYTYVKHTSMTTTLTNYKTSLGLPENVSNNLHYLTSAQANVLLNKVAYSIGTTTAISWWTSSVAYLGGTAPTQGNGHWRPILKEVCNENGEITTIEVGTVKHYQGASWGIGQISEPKSYNTLAGVRLGTIITL